MKKTAVLLAEGFEEIEALTAVDLLRRAQIVCDMVAVEDTDEVAGSHGITVRADCKWSGTDFDGYDGVILPGGLKGTKKLAEDGRVLELVRSFHAEGKLTAAICAGPTVLHKAGLLEGKRAVCHPGAEEQLTGALLSKEPVMADGNILTSRGMGTSIPFALALAEYFCSAERARELARAIVYEREG